MSQFLRPISDISKTSIYYSTGSSAYALIDEETPNDYDYIKANSSDNDNTVVGYCTLGLSEPLSPGAGDWIIRGRARRYMGNGSSFSTVYLKARLYQGAVAITGEETLVSTTSYSWATGTYTLSSAEVAAISDLSTLHLYLKLDGFLKYYQDQFHYSYCWCSWAEIEIPDAATVVRMGLEMGVCF